jgi:hypothetical protein
VEARWIRGAVSVEWLSVDVLGQSRGDVEA